MVKIATHDSATGEKSKNWLHALGKVFAMTQTKTIREQYDCGVRYFDLRVDKNLTLCHGLWKANKNLADIMTEIGRFEEKVYVTVTIERKYDAKTYEALCKKIRQAINLRAKGKVNLVYIAKKKPSWEVLKEYTRVTVAKAYYSVPSPQQYLTHPFKNWKRYIPIPWVLKKITPKVAYNDKWFTMVDFI